MVKVGQVVMKIAGRDAGEIGAVVDILDNNFVLVDGLIRRRKCNLRHLEFLNLELKIKKGKKREHKEKPKQLRKSNTTETNSTKVDSKTKKVKK